MLFPEFVLYFSPSVTPSCKTACLALTAHKCTQPAFPSPSLLRTVHWRTHLLNRTAISMQFVIWPQQKFPPGLSFVGESESFLPLKRGRCCGPWRTRNAWFLGWPPLHLPFINQNSSAEEALRLEVLLRALPPPSLLQRKPGDQALFNRTTRLEMQVAEVTKLICLCLLHWVLVPGINQVFTFAKSS